MLSAFDASDVSITYQDNRHLIPFDMKWDIEIENSREKVENAFIDYRTGVLTKSTCHGVADNCLHVSHKMLVHRSQPNLLLQTMRFTWTGFHLHEVDISINPPAPKSSIKKVKTTDSEKEEEFTYRIASGLYAAIIAEILPDSFALKGDEKTKLLSQKIVFGMAKTSEAALEVARKNMKTAQKESDLKLIDDHERAWKDLLHTGIHLDPNDPDPHHIIPRAQLVNSTVHSIMAVTPSKTQTQALGSDYQLVPNSPIMTPDYCYNGVATLHSNSLWKDVQTIDEAFALRDSWQLTLKNHGCDGLVYVFETVMIFLSYLFRREQKACCRQWFSALQVFNLPPSILHLELTQKFSTMKSGFQIFATKIHRSTFISSKKTESNCRKFTSLPEN